MKNKINNILLCMLTVLLVGCDGAFDVKYDANFKPEQVFVNYDRLKKIGMMPYTFVPNGLNRLDDAFFAAASDEAEHTSLSSEIQKFNLGVWNQYSNPDDQWANFYRGIYYANFFLERSVNYKVICAGDTITPNGKKTYEDQITDIEALINEVRVLRAYFHFELMKRYGEIPIITKTMTPKESLTIKKSSVRECTDFIVNECNTVKDNLVVRWAGYKDTEYGRIDKGTALALKSRTLLYAASPLFNPSNSVEKWELAASAAHEVISMNRYKLHQSYKQLFLPPNSYQSSEVIFMKMYASDNTVERNNYPIGTQGGKSGSCPSQNLVDAYEMKTDGSSFDWNNLYHAANPYYNRDPRLEYTVVLNNSDWNGRKIETYVGGKDGIDKKEASKTGYYLKKYVIDGLDLSKDQKNVHSWILFRYAEILLNYAEAMNEAYGPDSDPKRYGLTARDALNQIRSRGDVSMPLISTAVALDKNSFRDKVKNERRIELAFEEHRIWDVRRWTYENSFENSDAQKALSSPIYGINIQKIDDGFFTYSLKKIEERIFLSKMLFYPIPQLEINKYSGNLLIQNKGW